MKKHILWGKSSATNLKDAKAIIRTVEERGVIFQIGYIERFNKSYIIVQKAFQEGTIGKLISIRAQ